MGVRVHHSAIRVRDTDSSLRFYRDGMGLDVLMDRVFEGDWPTLFGVGSTRLPSIFLGDRRHPDAGVVELVAFEDDTAEHRDAAGQSGSAGFFLLSFYVDVDEVVARLATLGFGPARRIEQRAPTGSVAMATVHDRDGVCVELIGVPR